MTTTCESQVSATAGEGVSSSSAVAGNCSLILLTLIKTKDMGSSSLCIRGLGMGAQDSQFRALRV